MLVLHMTHQVQGSYRVEAMGKREEDEPEITPFSDRILIFIGGELLGDIFDVNATDISSCV